MPHFHWKFSRLMFFRRWKDHLLNFMILTNMASSTLLAHIRRYAWFHYWSNRQTKKLSLLLSMSEGGLLHAFIKWLLSFLKDRTLYVVVNGVTSSTTVDTSSAVPQCSVLAPYLFSALMRSLHPALPTAKIMKFADVTLLCPYQRHTLLEDLARIWNRNEEHDSTVSWSWSRSKW